MKRYFIIPILLSIAVTLFALSSAGCGNGEPLAEGEYYRDGAAVLMYHHLAETTGSSTVTPAQFAAHLEMLREEGFKVISIEDFGAFLKGEQDIPPNAVVITFDDGYASFYDYAYPELLARDMTAAVFIIGSRVGVTEGELPKLTWEQMQEMQRNGMSFYSHTYDSHYYVQVNADGAERPALVKEAYLLKQNRTETAAEFRTRVRNDLSRSYRELESNLGRSASYLALPYGWAGQTALDIANDVGFEFIFTIKPGINDRSTPKNKLYRINAGNPEISPQQLLETIQENVMQ